jgi:hypothetical protein
MPKSGSWDQKGFSCSEGRPELNSEGHGKISPIDCHRLELKGFFDVEYGTCELQESRR